MSRFWQPLILALALAGCKSPVVMQSYLSVVNISPPNGAADVDPHTVINATFSEPLVSDSVSSLNAWVEDDQGVEVDSTVAYDDDTWTITITPSQAFAEGSTYTAVFGTGIEGTQSGYLKAEIRSSFTTSGTPPLGDQMPVANAGVDQTVSVGDTVVLDGSASYDPEGATLSYLWSMVSVPDESTAAFDDTTAVAPRFIADLPGIYVVSLVVNDGQQDSSEDFAQIEAVTGDTGSD